MRRVALNLPRVGGDRVPLWCAVFAAGLSTVACARSSLATTAGGSGQPAAGPAPAGRPVESPTLGEMVGRAPVPSDDNGSQAGSSASFGQDAGSSEATPLGDITLPVCGLLVSDAIVVVTRYRQLHVFDPISAEFSPLPALGCSGAEPYSMAVAANGTALVLATTREDRDRFFHEQPFREPPGRLHEVELLTGACNVIEEYVPVSGDFEHFGMTFVSGGREHPERLYVASGISPPIHVGLIDRTSFVLRTVGTIDGGRALVELTGSENGRLFAMYTDADDAGETVDGARALLAELDQRSGQIVSEVDLSPITYPYHPSFALVHWHGDFYVFMGALAALRSDVWRYRPSDVDHDDRFARRPRRGRRTCTVHNARALILRPAAQVERSVRRRRSSQVTKREGRFSRPKNCSLKTGAQPCRRI